MIWGVLIKEKGSQTDGKSARNHFTALEGGWSVTFLSLYTYVHYTTYNWYEAISHNDALTHKGGVEVAMTATTKQPTNRLSQIWKMGEIMATAIPT